MKRIHQSVGTMLTLQSQRLLCLVVAISLFGTAGCKKDDSKTGSGKRSFLSIGTAPAGGAFAPVGDAIAETLNKHKGDNTWRAQAKGTKGSQDNIRGLGSDDYQLGMSNSAISFYSVKGEGSFKKKYDTRAIVTIAPNVAMFITTEGSGIKKMADLKGKRVTLGPAGAGFEMFVGPILKEHGVKLADLNVVNNTQTGAVEMLGDGSADAAFLGGALPTSSIVLACRNQDIHFIPFEPDVHATLLKKYPYFSKIVIKKDKYSDLTEDFVGLNVGSMHLITSAKMDDDVIYQVTKTIWENRAAIAKIHLAGKFIREDNAARFTGTEFHPGAVKFYKEIGLMEGGEKKDAAAGADDKNADESTEAKDQKDAPK